MKKVFIAFALVICIIFSACGQIKEEKDPKAVQKIVEEIAVDHGTYGAEADAASGPPSEKAWPDLLNIYSDRIG